MSQIDPNRCPSMKRDDEPMFAMSPIANILPETSPFSASSPGSTRSDFRTLTKPFEAIAEGAKAVTRSELGVCPVDCICCANLEHPSDSGFLKGRGSRRTTKTYDTVRQERSPVISFDQDLLARSIAEAAVRNFRPTTENGRDAKLAEPIFDDFAQPRVEERQQVVARVKQSDRFPGLTRWVQRREVACHLCSARVSIRVLG